MLFQQALQRGIDFLTAIYLVHIQAVSHQNHDIVRVPRQVIFYITNEIETFEDIDIVKLQACIIISGFLTAVNDTIDGAVQKASHGVIKAVEGSKCIFVLCLYLYSSLLETREHGTLTTCQVLTGIAVFANLVEYLL